MTDQDGIGEARARLDQLRRTLYGPTASEADRLEYSALADRLERLEQPSAPPAEPQPPAEPVEEPTSAPRAERRRTRPIVFGIAGAVVVAALAVVATQAARSVSAPPTTPSATAWLASPTAAPLPTPAVLPDGGQQLAAQQSVGGGSAVVRLDVRAAPRNGGRLVVAVSSSDPSPIGWLAERPRSGSSGAGAVELVASSAPSLREGAAAPTTVAYSGAPPSQLVVQAPTGTGWSVTVAFTAASATPR